MHTDVRSLYIWTSAAALDRVIGVVDVSTFNPIIVQSQSLGKLFYAILHRNDVGLVIDLKPIRLDDASIVGFDQVIAFKFHEVEHGEVVAKIRRTDLEPYMCLHYPPANIPQAARFLFMKNSTTPTEAQIVDIAAWLFKCHRDSTGPSTDSLAKAGYPKVACFDDAVYGLVVAKITTRLLIYIILIAQRSG
ncbi:hypothetical protein L7F22_021260 [Adiantum nelumboides]|nr:hypothetical protein [Adiantum nelumboides]